MCVRRARASAVQENCPRGTKHLCNSDEAGGGNGVTFTRDAVASSHDEKKKKVRVWIQYRMPGAGGAADLGDPWPRVSGPVLGKRQGIEVEENTRCREHADNLALVGGIIEKIKG
jgi:hypothetical protein